MDVDTVVQTTKWRLSRFTNTGSLTDEMVLIELNAAQRRLEHKSVLPWFLLSNLASEDLIKDEERVQLPDDFLMEDEDSDLWLVNPEGERTKLEKGDYDTIRNKYPKGGTPEAYAITGNFFRLRPVVDALGYKAEMLYVKMAPELSAGGGEGNEWIKHYPDLVIAETGKVLAEFYLKMPQAAQSFEFLRRECYADMLQRETYRDTVNADTTPED